MNTYKSGDKVQSVYRVADVGVVSHTECNDDVIVVDWEDGSWSQVDYTDIKAV